MKREKIILKINENHKSFIDYLSNLSKEEFEFSIDEKWTAGQQLEHIILSIKAILSVFSMDKLIIEQNFGRTDRPNRTYEVLLYESEKKLTEGGKSPRRFIPETIIVNQRESLSEKLTFLIKEFVLKIEIFSESELDNLLIPHPLLGNLTLREMLYNTVHHVEHHQLKAIANLKKKPQEKI